MISNEDYFNRGKSALLYFHNRAVFYSDYNLSFNDLVTLVENRGYKNFLRGLGMGIIDAEIPEFNVRAGMEKLASNGRGKIPATNGAFTQAIASNVSDNISYVDAIAWTAKESADDLKNMAVEIGEGVQFGLKNWYIILPLVLGVGIYIHGLGSRGVQK